MIRYTLKCADAHVFESWFKSADGFDTLKSTGMVSCPVCGTDSVEKAIMAPRVRPARDKASAPSTEPETLPAKAERPLQAPASEAEVALSKLRKEVEANSDYVGLGFVAEARKMHDGDIPHRAIYGEAKLEEAKKLVEDGVPVAPLPFIPVRKTN